MKAVFYRPEMAEAWDTAVRASRNGTFLFERGFMDYHHDRFEDGSVMFYDDGGELAGLLPANVERERQLLSSHSGLTYGGLVLSPQCGLVDVREMFRLVGQLFLDRGINTLVYKPTPYIYHSYPAEEDLYWLFRAKAGLEARTVSSAIVLTSDLHSALWHRKTKKKACAELQLGDDIDDHLPEFWEIVTDVLRTRHAVRPVHALSEVALLKRRFPDNIRLHTVTNSEGAVIAGCLAFVACKVVHIQYMEAGEEGRQRRALDWLMKHLIGRYADCGMHYFEFGISTEQGGRLLNEGLAYQKEGFGGRAVCYDTYSVKLENLMAL